MVSIRGHQPFTDSEWIRVFLTKVYPDAHGCWNWQGYKHKGYGTVARGSERGGGMSKAHRAYYEYDRGSIPPGLTLDHLCRNRACVNPDHLEPVTNQENIRRGHALRPKATHCRHGHAFDEANTYYSVRPGRTFLQRKCRACNREFETRRRAGLKALTRQGAQ